MDLMHVTRQDLEKIGISLNSKIKLPSEVEGDDLKKQTLTELRKQFGYMESDFTQTLTNYQLRLTDLKDGLLNHVSRRLDKDGLEEAIVSVTQDIERLEKTKSSLQAIMTGQSTASPAAATPTQPEQPIESKPKAKVSEESPAPKAERPQPVEQPVEQKQAAAPSASSTPKLDQALAILDGAGDIKDKPQALQFVRDLWKETQGKKGNELARYTEVMAQLGESTSAPIIAAAVELNKNSIFTDKNQDGRISMDEAKSRLRYSGGVDTLKEAVSSGFYTVDDGVQGMIDQSSRAQQATKPAANKPTPEATSTPAPESKVTIASSVIETPMLNTARAILGSERDFTDKPQALQFVRDLWKETQGKHGNELAPYTEVLARLGESKTAPIIAAAVELNKNSIFTDKNQDGRISMDEAKSRLRYSGGVDTLKEAVSSGFYAVDEGVQGAINRESRLQEVDKSAKARAEAASWERGFREDWSSARQGDQAAMDRLHARDKDHNGVLNAQDNPGAREPLKDYLNQHPVKLDDIAHQGGLVSKQDIKDAGKALRNMDVGMYVPTPYGTYEVHGRNNGAVRIAEIDAALQRGTDVKGIVDLNHDGVVTKGELKQVLDASGLKQNINELAQHMGMAGITIQEGNSSPVHNNTSPNNKGKGL